MRDRVVNYILQNQVLSAILVIAVAWLALEIREMLIALFVSYILMAAVTPYVDSLRRSRVPKPIAILIPYLITIVFIILIIVSLLPFFVQQVGLLLMHLPGYAISSANTLGIPLDGGSIAPLVTAEFGSFSTGIVSITSKLFGGFFALVSIFVISFYLLVYKEQVEESFTTLFPKKEQGKVKATLEKVEDKLGSWLRGQILLSGFIGVTTWIFLSALGIEFALPLATVAGLLEIVPTIGPTVAAIPSIMVALTISFPLAILVALLYVLMQFIESHVLVPRIMQRAVGLNPIVIILGIIAGGKLLGPVGALLAVPFISLIVVVNKNL
ncbi:MAG TPA: AI-2E family transporter [Patescibacteria group bacterium]|nr:AI-2E family transporter [Patescibacteria group bacterium]